MLVSRQQRLSTSTIHEPVVPPASGATTGKLPPSSFFRIYIYFLSSKTQAGSL